MKFARAQVAVCHRFNPNRAQVFMQLKGYIPDPYRGSWARYGPNEIDCRDMRRLFRAKKCATPTPLHQLSKRTPSWC
jgi:hypothetical protein